MKRRARVGSSFTAIEWLMTISIFKWAIIAQHHVTCSRFHVEKVINDNRRLFFSLWAIILLFIAPHPQKNEPNKLTNLT